MACMHIHTQTRVNTNARINTLSLMSIHAPLAEQTHTHSHEHTGGPGFPLGPVGPETPTAPWKIRTQKLIKLVSHTLFVCVSIHFYTTECMPRCAYVYEPSFTSLHVINETTSAFIQHTKYFWFVEMFGLVFSWFRNNECSLIESTIVQLLVIAAAPFHDFRY